MSLLFTNAVSDRVDHGSNASLDNLAAGTCLAWIYRTTSSSDRMLFCKGRTDLSRAKYLKINSSDNAQGAGSVQLGIYRATTPLLLEPTGTDIAQDVWKCLAATWDTAGANGDQHMYVGDLSTQIAEYGAYTVRQVGTGTVADDSADNFVVGNRPDTGTENLSFAGRISIFAIWNRVLTLGELQTQQYAPSPTSGCVLFARLNSTSTITDESGNSNTGTVTGATLADDVPLNPKQTYYSYRRRVVSR